jgi:hypothetical protein
MGEDIDSTPPVPQDFADVRRIAETRGVGPRNVDELNKIVEAPLLPAARLLYERGVQTTESSANPEHDTDGYGKMTINYDTLSEENKHIAQELAQANEQLPPESRPISIIRSGDGYMAVTMRVPLQGSVDEIAANAAAVAEQFAPQPMYWAPRYTLDELKAAYTIPAEENMEPAEFETEGYYYDPDRQLFFHSEDHAVRSQELEPYAPQS